MHYLPNLWIVLVYTVCKTVIITLGEDILTTQALDGEFPPFQQLHRYIR